MTNVIFEFDIRAIYGVKNLLGYIDEPNRGACNKLLEDNLDLFSKSPGSSANHQAWPGGYLDHVYDTMVVGRRLHSCLSGLKKLNITISDIMLVMFLHDLEKPWKYVENKKFASKAERRQFVLDKAAEYNIALDDNVINALKYVEGEGDDYSGTRRVMSPLAAICHMADITSARIWPVKDGLPLFR